MSLPNHGLPSTAPALLAGVEVDLGKDAADRLSARFGGCRVYVPRKPTARIIEAVGAQIAAWLSDRYGGEFISVPMGARSHAATVAERIAALTAAGRTAGDIAVELGVSERTVSRHRAKMRTENTAGGRA